MKIRENDFIFERHESTIVALMPPVDLSTKDWKIDDSKTRTVIKFVYRKMSAWMLGYDWDYMSKRFTFSSRVVNIR